MKSSDVKTMRIATTIKNIIAVVACVYATIEFYKMTESLHCFWFLVVCTFFHSDISTNSDKTEED